MSANVHKNLIDNTNYIDNNFYSYLFDDSDIPMILFKDRKIIDLSKNMLSLLKIKDKNNILGIDISYISNYIENFDLENILLFFINPENINKEFSFKTKINITNLCSKLINVKISIIKYQKEPYFLIRLIEFDSIIKNYIDIISFTDDKTNEAVWDWNLKSNIPFYSSKFFSILDYDLNEFPHSYDYWRELIHPEDLEIIEKDLKSIIQSQSEFSIEYRMKSKKGHWVWILSKGKIIEWDENDIPIRMIGTHANISEKKKAEENNIIYRQQLEETNKALVKTQDILNKRLITLTQPLVDTSDISIYDLFDIDELQSIQDSFADATGVASLITLPDGTPVTKPTNFCRLCNEIIRKTHKGLINCMLSDTEIGRSTANGPNCQTCLSGGLIDGGASIMVGDRQIGNWLIGQVIDSDVDLSVLVDYAAEIGADKEVYLEALKEVKRMPKSQFVTITNALYIITKQLSKLALQNVQQAREITKRKKVEQALSDSELKFKSAMSQIPGIIWTTDCDLNIVQIFGQGLKNLTMSVVDMVGMNLQKFYGSDNPYFYPIQIHKTVLTGSSGHYEVNFGNRAFSCEVEPLKNYSGEIIGTLGIAIDITERKKTEEALNDSLKRFKDVTNAAGEFIWETDEEFNFKFVTQKAEEIFGYSRQELLNKSINELSYIEDKNSSAYFFKELLNFADEFKNFQSRFVTEQGNIVWLNISGTPIYDSMNNLIGFRGTGLNITKEKNAYKEKEQLIETLELKNSEMERFTYTVSHDLRSPLITIKGFIGMLNNDLKENRPDRVEDDLNRISNAADKMQVLLEDLLALSRIGRVTKPSELVDMNKLIPETIELLKGITDGIDINFKIANEFMPIWGEKNRIREVFQNIIENSVKFRNTDSTLEITINQFKNDEFIIFSITDNGIGIDSKYFDKIFGLFEKLNQNKEGTGVGLALVKRIIELHKGKIWVESDGFLKGSTFYIAFPKKIISI